MVKNLLARAGDLGDIDSIPELGRSPEGRQALQSTPVFLPGEPLRQRSLVGMIHSITQSKTQLKQLSMHERM